MFSAFASVIDCVRFMHDSRLMAISGLVCAVGIYASFAIGKHATRATGAKRIRWGAVGTVASGSTAWATHFIVLLAFKPGMAAAFEPVLTAVSLTCAIIGIGAGMAVSIRVRRKAAHFAAGLIVGLGVATLHYVGQAAYLVQGTVSWNLTLVATSILASLPISGVAMVAVASRQRQFRACAAPLLLGSIALLHFCGMAAMTLHYDPARRFPADAVSPHTIAPVVAGVSLALIVLAVVGWRLDLAAKIRLRRDRQRLAELADVALEGLLICEGDAVIAANSSVEGLSRNAPGTLAGTAVSLLLPGLDIQSLPEREERETDLVDAAGQKVPVRVLRHEVELGHKVQTVIAVRDQRERLKTEATMHKLAFTDARTGFANRARFLDLLALNTASRRQRDAGSAVLMIDIDRFKLVNDTLGHAAGDIVLRMVADRLRSTLRSGDVVARLGADEFAVLQDAGVDGDAATLAARIVEVIKAHPFMLEGQPVHLGASVGITIAGEDGGDAAQLMRNADLALHAAKADGGGTFRRYDTSLDEKARARRETEAGLRRALANGELELHYQPLVDAASGRITSAEALVRWNHPERGSVPPAEFIGVAEEIGLIVPLGSWVVRTACAEAAGWPDDICVAVNLSPAQFCDEGLIATVVDALAHSGLAPHRLELEITEGVLLSDREGTLRTLEALRSLGIHVAMDDFGTGYSSLTYLRKFPFDKLKIDQSFVRQLPHDTESAAIVRAIITMADSLGMATTVEGVETPEQFAFSAAAGCTSIQGFLVSRPLNRHAFAAFVAQRQAASPSVAA